MAFTFIANDFNDPLTAGAWTATNSWAVAGRIPLASPWGFLGVSPGNQVGGALFNVNNTGGTASAIKSTLNLYPLLQGSAQYDKVLRTECDLVWRHNPTAGSLGNLGTGTFAATMGVLFAAPVSGTQGWGLFITRTNSTTTNTTEMKLGLWTGVNVVSIGSTTISLPNANNGDRWQLDTTMTFAKPTFLQASIVVNVKIGTTNYSISTPSFVTAGAYAAQTGQASPGTAGWSAVQMRSGFFYLPGAPLPYVNGMSAGYFPTDTSNTYVMPNQFERFRVRDVGLMSNYSPPINYTFAPSVAYSPAGVSVEKNATAYTLDVQPSWSQETLDQWETSTFVSDSGDRVVRPLQSRRRRKWSMRWTSLDSSQQASLASLVANVKGRFATWTWTDPQTNVAVDVRFISDLEFTKVGPNTWTAAADVEEVLS